MKKLFFLALSLLYATFLNAQLSGTYTINSNASQNPDYTSFGAAVSALSAGVSGPVTFEVSPGTYEEYVNLNAITGTSDVNRVIFRGMGNTHLDVILTSNAGYTDNSTLKLNGTGYVTFENMTLTTTSANKARVVTMMGGVNFVRFNDVRFVGRVSTGNNDGDANIVYRASGEWTDHFNEFTQCEFVNGFIALYYQGVNIYQYNEGLLVEGCTFTNQSSKSIYITFTDHVTVRGNTVNNDYDEKSDYNAIDVYRCRYNCLFEDNVMNVTRNSNYTNVFRMRPVVGTATEPVIIRNNIINLQCNTNSSYCCNFDYDDCDYIYFAHNTLKCSGTGNVGNLFVEDDWSNLFMYNNLIVNETPGYVFRFQNNSADRFCDYNRIVFSGSNIGKVGSTDYASLSDWTAATGFDTHSALCTPQFVGNNDLHITNNDGLTVAHPLDYVTTDIDGDPRGNTPCAGADEYASGVNLPPVVANPISTIVFETYPANQTIDLNNTFTDPDDPDEGIVITVSSNSNPSLVSTTLNNRLLTVQRLQPTAGNAVIILMATSNGQSVQTSFTVECVAEDLPPVVANPLAPIHFTSFPQHLSFELTNTFDDPDNNNEFIEITLQSCPSEVSAFIDNKTLHVSRTTPNAFSNKTMVIRATSNNQYVDMSVNVSGNEAVVVIDVADFEDVALNSQGIWQGEEGENNIFSGGWTFTNYYSDYFWGGFTVSNRTNLTPTGLDAQYTAITGGGYDGSAQYAVAYTMGAQTDVSATDGTLQTITGCYVTNNLWAYQNMLEGDYSVTPFGGATGNDPDWFKLTATGKNANGQTTGTLDFYLADYRFSNNNEDYILNTWEWFDLSPLGQVASISFSLSSSKSNSYGMITPAYFCMDNFNGADPNQDLPPYIANPVEDVVFNNFPETITVNLNGVATDPDDPDENITYSIVSNSNPNALSATLNNKSLTLTRQNHNAATANIVMRASSDGQSVDFNIHVIINAATDLPPVIANPVADVIFNHYPQTLQVNLNGVATDPDDPDENITYSIVSNSNPAALVAQINGKMLTLTRLTSLEDTADLVMRAISNGQSVDFNIHVILNQVVGVEEQSLTAKVYPNPTRGLLTLSVKDASFHYTIYNLKGQRVMNGTNHENETHLDISGLPQGVYFLTFECNDQRWTQKVIKE